jgi:RNA polymerase sigma factor (sigma-70 family)
MKNKIMDKNILEKKNKYNQLFDYYGCLLTVKQQEYFTSYYFDDLSLSEIASIYNISRNAVHDQLKKIYDLLDYYEENLHLFSKHIKYK